MYVEEGIDWSWVDFVDNQDVLDLLEGGTGTAVGAGAGGGTNGVLPPKVGVFPLLDEACRLPRATNKDLALTIRENLQTHPRFSAPKRVGIDPIDLHRPTCAHTPRRSHSRYALRSFARIRRRSASRITPGRCGTTRPRRCWNGTGITPSRSTRLCWPDPVVGCRGPSER